MYHDSDDWFADGHQGATRVYGDYYMTSLTFIDGGIYGDVNIITWNDIYFWTVFDKGL